MVLSQVKPSYLYYLELFLSVLQNYRIKAFLNLRLSPSKLQKVEKQQNQNRSINHYKSIIDILIGYNIGWIFQDSQPPPSRPRKVT